MHEEITKGAHIASYLLRQGIHNLLRLSLDRLQDLVQAEVRSAEIAVVAEQPEVGEDQLAWSGEQVTALALHDCVQISANLL